MQSLVIDNATGKYLKIQISPSNDYETEHEAVILKNLKSKISNSSNVIQIHYGGYGIVLKELHIDNCDINTMYVVSLVSLLVENSIITYMDGEDWYYSKFDNNRISSFTSAANGNIHLINNYIGSFSADSASFIATNNNITNTMTLGEYSELFIVNTNSVNKLIFPSSISGDSFGFKGGVIVGNIINAMTNYDVVKDKLTFYGNKTNN